MQTNYNDKRAFLPANWNPGDDVMVPYLNDEDKAEINKPNSRLYQLSWFMTYRRLADF